MDFLGVNTFTIVNRAFCSDQKNIKRCVIAII